jgi:N-acetylglutamate synthase/N-acetylornithine aminotransferase
MTLNVRRTSDASAIARTERAGEAARETARRGVRRGEAPRNEWTCDLSADYVKINAEYRT